jgi:hypothetical protein
MDNKLELKIIELDGIPELCAEQFTRVIRELWLDAFTVFASSATNSMSFGWPMGDFERRAASRKYVCCGSRADLRAAGEEIFKSILRKGLPGINLFSM